MNVIKSLSLIIASITILSANGENAKGDKLRPLPARALELKGSLERDINCSLEGWILGDAVPYREFATLFKNGRPKFATGEMWGKFARSAAMFYRATGDQRIKARLKEMVDDILATERPNGSISCTKEADQPGKRDGDLWERKYVLLGLEGYYQEVEADPKVLASMRRQADAIIAVIGPAPKIDVRSLGWSPNHVESSTLLEPIMRLYNITGEARYLEFARYLVECGGAYGSNLIDMAAAKVPPHLMAGVYPKAYETTSYFEGLVEYYRVTGDERVKKACLNYFQMVRDRELTIVGNGGADQPYHPRVLGEAWSYTAREQTNPDIKRMMETCTGVTWLKYCSQILRLTADCSAAEAIETYVYNGLIGAMRPDGKGFSYVNLLDGEKVTNKGWGWDFNGKLVTCCNLNGPMGLAYIPFVAVMEANDGIVINLYNGLTAKFKTPSGQSATLEMATDYPLSGAVKISIALDKPEEFVIRLRNPKFGNICALGDRALPPSNESRTTNHETRIAEYLALKQKWASGDKIELTFDLKTRLVKGPKGVNRAGDNRVALMYGPIVLARDSHSSEDIDKPVKIIADADGIVAAERIDPKPYGARLAFRVPTTDGPITMVDYASIDCWSGGRVRTWLKE